MHAHLIFKLKLASSFYAIVIKRLKSSTKLFYAKIMTVQGKPVIFQMLCYSTTCPQL